MKKLLLANTIWAFSFSFIGHYVSGKVDIYLSIFIRLVIGLIFWLPFLKYNKEVKKLSWQCMLVGAIQIGFMYLAYYNSYKYLQVTEVALFTITTPLYISCFSSLIEKRINWRAIIAALCATMGALIIKWSEITSDFLLGFLLVQVANSCFALGQLLYRKYLAGKKSEKSFFAYFYMGALIPILPFLFFRLDKLSWQMPQSTIFTLLWLGLIASGLAYYLWNSGTHQVNASQLAVLNNVLIPMAIVVNLLFWSAKIEWFQFLIGSSVILFSLFLGESKSKNNAFIQ